MMNNVLRSRSYSYTLAGMISRVDMEDGGKVEYTYDSLDRLTAEKRTDPYGQILAWDLFEYDLAGNRTRKTILDVASNALMTVNYALSTGNRLASWAVPETNLMARFPVVGAASEAIGTNNRFGTLWISNATPGGMSVKPEVDGTNFWVYDFTVGLGTQQVVAAIRDMAGNMAYVTNTVIPSVVTNGAYQYSAAGCLTNMAYAGPGVAQTLRLTLDGQYQLTGVSTGAVVESYAYDALGRRVMTAAGGVTNWHVYDLSAPSAGGQAGGLQVIADLDSTGAVVRTYVWGPGIDNLLAMTIYGGATNTYYALKDHLNSVLAMTDSSGQIVEQYRYDAWGRTTVFDGNGNPLSTSTVGNRYCWQGREYSWTIHAANNGNGLYYFRARWYEPVTGRWLSNDPIGISGGLNQYEFCANNPVNFVDPFGLYQYTTANPFLGFLHQMNPFNMDGSVNAQFAAAWALGMGDTASAMQWSGQGQLDDTCAGKGWKGVYWGAIGVSAAADAAAGWMIGTEALAANGSFNVANSVANRAASPFLRNEGARWFSQTQAEALMNGPRLANTGQGVRNLLTTFRYASPGNGEVVLNWITRTVIHANPFF